MKIFSLAFFWLQVRISLSSDVAEVDVVNNELKHFKRAVNEMRQKDIKLKGFYHVSNWRGAPYWKDVVREQMHILDGKRIPDLWSNNLANTSYSQDMDNMYQTKVNLLEETDQLYVNIVGDHPKHYFEIADFMNSLDLNFKDRLYYNYNKTVTRGSMSFARKCNNQKEIESLEANEEISEGEFSTMTTIQKYCKNEINHGRNSYVYYLHSKGGCCIRGKPRVLYDTEPVASWRELLNTFTIEFPSICLRALNLGYSTCGAELLHSYYAGNFW